MPDRPNRVKPVRAPLRGPRASAPDTARPPRHVASVPEQKGNPEMNAKTTSQNATALYLAYLPVNDRYAFTTDGRKIWDILGQRTFATRREAAAAIEPLNMKLQGNRVVITGRNPFDPWDI